ncbi:MAG: NfeD family protein [Candidatus Omnitrophota bacterium]
MENSKLILKLILITNFIILLSIPALCNEPTQINSDSVYFIPVKGTIDLGLSSFIVKCVQEAQEKKALAIVLEIDTFGGRVDAANDIVTSIQKISPLPTFAYITNSAWSAGALIALSCKNIIMKKGASIGSAEPRILGLTPGAESVDEKTISALRAKFKATAEASNHNSALAVAMVDKDVELIKILEKDGFLILTRDELTAKKSELKLKNKDEKIINKKEKLLNLTAQEAFDLKLAVLIVDSEKDFIEYLKQTINPVLKNLDIFRPQPTWSENLVRFLTHPIVSSLLLSLGFLGLIFELKIPGWGISGTLGVIFIILFFWGHYLVGLASWLDILILVIGVILLFIELFIIPGFGVFGITGIILIISGLTLSLIKYPLTFPSLQLGSALSTLGFTLIALFIFFILLFRFFPQSKVWKHILLSNREEKNLGFEVKSIPENINIDAIGTAQSILRPSGRAQFNNISIDVTTQGDFIPKGEKIKIVRISGNKIFVEKIREL